MLLTNEQKAILDGSKGETMAKVMKTLVMYGDAFTEHPRATPLAIVGDGDLSLAAGDADYLTALGAIVVAVLPILQPVEKLKRF